MNQEPEQEELTGEEKLEGHLHDIISDLLYEKLDTRSARKYYWEVDPDHRRDAVDRVHEDVVEMLDEKAREMENHVADLDPAGCSACGGSGGGRPPHICPKCGGSGRA